MEKRITGLFYCSTVLVISVFAQMHEDITCPDGTICRGETACKPASNGNGSYSCICYHDNQPPTNGWECKRMSLFRSQETNLTFLPWMPTTPRFTVPLNNVTVRLGGEAVITCTVDNLSSYKVAFVRVDTKSILTIHTHVITRNHRINLSRTNNATITTWNLLIKNVRESDRGWYMCQLNTDPMMSQTGYLQVVVSPEILDYPTSTDMMVVKEGSNVELQCATRGFPVPKIIWRREDRRNISYENSFVDGKEGAVLNFYNVNRLHMGTYLCIASNGIPPTVSRRISLIVHFPPVMFIPNQLVAARLGQNVVLECQSEASPRSITFWRRYNGDIIVQGKKYEVVVVENEYKITMQLTIRAVVENDFGVYVCNSKNSLGEAIGSIRLYDTSNPPNPPELSEKVGSEQLDGTSSSDSHSLWKFITIISTILMKIFFVRC